MEGMGATNTMCPVCTLYLRPGISLENHLASHPKQKVIEALIRVAQLTPQSIDKLNSDCEDNQPPIEMSVYPPVNVNSGITQPPPNQSFIYQQFMSSTGSQPVINVNPMNQQFVAVPTLFNPMICPPYIFQQQQQVQILSGTNMPGMIPRQSADMYAASNPAICASSTTIVSNPLDTNIHSSDSPHKYGITTSSTISEKTVKIENVRIIERACEPSSESVLVLNSYSDLNDCPSQITEEKHTETLEDCPSPRSFTTEKNELIIEEVNNLDDDEVTNVIEISHTEQTNWDDKVIDDLSKACQTTIADKEVITEYKVNEIDLTADENEMLEESEVIDFDMSDTRIHGKVETEIVPNDNVTVVEIGEVNLIQELIQNGESIISKVDNVECMNNSTEQTVTQIMMNIKQDVHADTQIIMKMDEDKFILGLNNDDMKSFTLGKLDDESMLRESLNIRADERMPPRGELSEQESNGASEVGWGSRIYQESSPGMSTSYDLLARESWEASDCSDTEITPLQSRILPTVEEDNPEVEETDEDNKKSVLCFTCLTCGATFRCPKERRVHQTKEHGASSTPCTTKKIFKKRQTCVSLRIDKAETKRKANLLIKEEEDVENNVIKSEELEIPDEKEHILCNICGIFIPTLKDLTTHNKKVHKIRSTSTVHICKICSETFITESKYVEHLKIHPLECNICGKNFFKMSNLQLHLKRHMGVRPYKCDVCSKAFLTKQKLGEHHNIHTGNAPIKCNLCDDTFRRHSNLIQHRNRHHLNIKKKIKDYVCPCGEIFHSKSKFSWHKEIHEAKPKSCRYCYEKFIHMASLTRHIRRAHNQRYVPDLKRENENVECSICKGVYLKSSLDAHLYTHSGKKQHSCTICSKEFTTKWNLKLHKWTHAAPNSKPFRCEICQAAFIRKSDYVSHMNSHRSIRPYTCNYCGCKFIRKYNCLRHVREHEEGKSFNCEICNKSFHRSYYLKEHMRVHSGVRPFSCHICGKTSATKSNHNKHMKIHHAREPVSTEG